MAPRTMLKNEVKTYRTRLGWSQAELARRAGLSRAGVSAVETGRLVPSTAAALALAAALGCMVESLFRLSDLAASGAAETWAWPPPTGGRTRYWRALIGGRRRLYPVEASALGLLPHDGIFEDGVFHDHASADPEQTLILACCDPAVGLLAAELLRAAGLRLIVLPRNSRTALELLGRGLVHAAGIHFGRSDQTEGNAVEVRRHVRAGSEREYRLLRVADWEEGIALAPGVRVATIRAAVGAKLRWVTREQGSGAQQCFDELLARAHVTRLPSARLLRAHDHRAVADAIRAKWADAGICLRLVSEEANLSFLSVRREAYDICMADSLAADPRGQMLVRVVRSAGYRRILGELPGYDVTRTGELGRVRVEP
jgi:molybdate-binding protein/DNA-binding XRE family transcriptional regulator